MVSGFLTSPCDHCRMSSAVASPMRSSSKKLTSSTSSMSSRFSCSGNCVFLGGVGEAPDQAPPRLSDFLDAARLTPGQVDAQFLRGAEHLVIGLAHLEGDAVAGEHLNVQAQRLQLLEQHLERLRNARLGNVLALDDGLV